MYPTIWQLGQWRQHIVEEVFSLLQLLACICVPELMLPEEYSVRIKFWNNTLTWHCLLFQHPSLRDAGKLYYSKELKLSDISLYTFYTLHHLEDYKNIKFRVWKFHVGIQTLDNVDQALLFVSADDGGHLIGEDSLQHLDHSVLTILSHSVLGPCLEALSSSNLHGFQRESLLAFESISVKLKASCNQPCFPVLVLFKGVQNLSESITLILSMIILYQTNNFMITPNLVTLSLTWSPDISQRPFHCPE